MVVHRFEVYLVPLDPERGHEMQKTRPCVIVSPGIGNRYLQTVLIAPLTSVLRKYPFRVPCQFDGRTGEIAIDQIRCVDHSRLFRRLGSLDTTTASELKKALVKFFG